MRGTRLKERLRSGEVCLGTISSLASPAVVEIIGRAGFDWVIIDCEHAPIGPFDTLLLEGLLRAADVSGVTPLVRVPENDATMIMKVLDSGAAGIVVPHVNDADSARRAVEATRYPPDGARGTCSNTRATGYYSTIRTEGDKFWTSANEGIITVILVEEHKAIENLDDILSVPGIDVAYIGTRDLAMSMGETDMNAPPVREAVARVTSAALAKGVAVGRGFYYPNIASAADMVREGATFLPCTMDVRIFYEACSQITRGVKKALASV